MVCCFEWSGHYRSKRLLVTLIGLNVADLSQDDFVLQPFDKTVRISSPPSTGHAAGADFSICLTTAKYATRMTAEITGRKIKRGQ